MNVIISSDSGYPYKYTPGNVKSEFVLRGLKEAGANVLFIDTLWGSDGVTELKEGLSPVGLPYISFPRNHGVLSLFYNIPLYWKIIRRRKETDDVNVFIDAPLIAFVNIICFLLFKLCGYRIALISHEYYQSFNHKKLWSRFNVWTNDTIVPLFSDCIHPISHYLWDYDMRFKKPMKIIPILADFNKSDKEELLDEQYFAFCGSALYFLRNTILAHSFKILKEEYPFIKFKLILGQIGDLQVQLDKMIEVYGLKDNISQFSGLPQNELYNIYRKATGLLIPLDPDNLQDNARFSQKIAEYVSCQRPIITSRAGEIPYYFKDRFNAMIVDYSPEAYAKAMGELLENLDLADMIGMNGFITGKEQFNYATMGKELFEFYHTF